MNIRKKYSRISQESLTHQGMMNMQTSSKELGASVFERFMEASVGVEAQSPLTGDYVAVVSSGSIKKLQSAAFVFDTVGEEELCAWFLGDPTTLVSSNYFIRAAMRNLSFNEDGRQSCVFFGLADSGFEMGYSALLVFKGDAGVGGNNLGHFFRFGEGSGVFDLSVLLNQSGIENQKTTILEFRIISNSIHISVNGFNLGTVQNPIPVDFSLRTYAPFIGIVNIADVGAAKISIESLDVISL